MPTATLNNRRIAIMEDDPINRQRWQSLIRLCGGMPIPVYPAPRLNEFESFLDSEDIAMLMCDNRLFERNYADYYGAEAIAKSYRSGRGGVLVTAYERDDADLSIREHRRWIPQLIHGLQLNSQELCEKLIQADSEVRENRPIRQREPHRTIMSIKNLVPIGERIIVKVVMSQWDIANEVGFPLDMVPENIRAHVSIGSFLIAQVNIEAERSEDIYFDQFEVPDPNVIRKLQSFFGHP